MPDTFRSRRALLLAAAVAVAVLVVILVVALSSGSGSSPAAPSAVSRPGPESIFEAEGELHANPAAALDAMRKLGVERVRVYVAWRAIAPDPDARTKPAGFAALTPAAYPASNWALYDTIVRDAHARGIGLDFTLGGPAPLWAAGPGAPAGAPDGGADWMPSAGEFGAFVAAVGARYTGQYTPPGSTTPLPRVNFWAIWNEPNYGPDLAPQAIHHSTVEVSPTLYRGLLNSAWSALVGTGHGPKTDTIVFGELAPRGLTVGDNPGNFSGMVPLRFVRALYCVDSQFHVLTGAAATARGCPSTQSAARAFPRQNPALFQAGGVADHPYPQGQIAPNVVTAAEPDYADLAALPNLERTLDRAQAAYGSVTHLPIYDTEFGYQTDPPEKIARAIDPRTAALYLNWAEYLHWRDPRVRSYDQYLLADPSTANAAGGFATGLEFKDGTPKATYDAYRMPLYLPVTKTGSGKPLQVWGCVRPARYAGHKPQVAQIQFAPGSGGAFKTIRKVTITNPHGYFDVDAVFPSSGSVRVQWAYPGGPAIHSRVVSISVQ